MSTELFVDHTIESAPPPARRSIAATGAKLGYLPTGVARIAESPELLDGFLKATALFESTTLDPVAREVVIMTMATRNRCHLCVAMHTARLVDLGADRELITCLREATSLSDPRLEVLRTFTLHVLDTAGAAEPEALQTFLAHGFSRRNALEVVLGIGTYTMSTLANRLTRAPIDPQLASYACLTGA